MAARLNPKHDEATRAKIQTSQLINRLMKHAIGEAEMTPTQVRAAEVLLKKTLPDLSATELSGGVTQRTVSGEPMSEDEWARSYGSDLASAGGAAKSTH